MNMVFNKNLDGSDRRLLQLRGFRIALREDITDDQIEMLSGNSDEFENDCPVYEWIRRVMAYAGFEPGDWMILSDWPVLEISTALG